jgi:tocopherol O-methyltransferase
MTPPGQTSSDILPTVRRYYDATGWDYRVVWRAHRYRAFHFGFDHRGTRSHGAALLNTNRELATRARIGRRSKVLDAGCGIGGSSIWLASTLGALVTGLTPVMSQVREARRLAIEAGQHALRFVPGDYTCMPFADGSFDVVWALESLCHAGEKTAFYGEAFRVLRPGGRLVVAEYMRTTRDLDESGRQMMHRWLSGWAIPDLATRGEHVQYARKMGFDSVVAEDCTNQTRRSLRRLYRLARACQPFAFAARALRLRSETMHGNFMSSILHYKTLRRGYWRYCVLTAEKPPVA